jgi:NitT/TauT family transport system ATP-binding protein
VTFGVEDGEFVCVVGPSGCGKTTLLKCIAGLLRPTRGEIVLRGRRVTAPPDEMALVFQEYGRSLMPWASVRSNVLLPLRHKPIGRNERAALVEDALESVGLTRFIDHYPWQLSGGMQQRAGLARALAVNPAILLMDEPFGAVDAQTRQLLQEELLELWQRERKTVIFVTHSMDEAVYLSDRVVVMTPRPGKVAEILDVPLPRPRVSEQVRRHAKFVDLTNYIWESLKRAMENHR